MTLVMVSAGGVGSVKEGSPFETEVFFSKSHITLQKWFLLMFWWSHEYLVTDAKKIADVDEGTAIVYGWLREICSSKLLQTPIVLGGPGIIVQIDESLFRHKPEVFTHSITQFKSNNIEIISESPWKGYLKRSVGIWSL